MDFYETDKIFAHNLFNEKGENEKIIEKNRNSTHFL